MLSSNTINAAEQIDNSLEALKGLGFDQVSLQKPVDRKSFDEELGKETFLDELKLHLQSFQTALLALKKAHEEIFFSIKEQSASAGLNVEYNLFLVFYQRIHLLNNAIDRFTDKNEFYENRYNAYLKIGEEASVIIQRAKQLPDEFKEVIAQSQTHLQLQRLFLCTDVSELEKLPIEVIHLILSKASVEEILIFARLNKRCQHIANADILWKYKFSEDFKHAYQAVSDVDKSDLQVGWREKYMALYKKRNEQEKEKDRQEERQGEKQEERNDEEPWEWISVDLASHTSMSPARWQFPMLHSLYSLFSPGKENPRKRLSSIDLEQLPDDLIAQVAKQLDLPELYRLRMTSKAMHQFLPESGVITEAKFKEYFPLKYSAMKSMLNAILKIRDSLYGQLSELKDKPDTNQTVINILKQAAAVMEKRIHQFWFTEFFAAYRYLLARIPNKLHLKKLFHSIMRGDMDEIKANIARDDTWSGSDLTIFFEIIHFLGKREALSNLFYSQLPVTISLSPWVFSICSGQDISVILQKTNNNLSVHTLLGHRPLHAAVMMGDFQLVVQLVYRLVDVNAQIQGGYTALHSAAVRGFTHIAEFLINQGANINTATKLGATPLHLAACRGRTDIVDKLLKAGAKIETLENQGKTALYLAAESGHADTVCCLAPQEMNTRCYAGMTPLHIAAKNGHTDSVIVLAASGAEINATLGTGETSLHLAAESGYAETVSVLLNAGANIQAVNKQGITPVCLAAAQGRTEVIKLLLEQGAFFTEKDIKLFINQKKYDDLVLVLENFQKMDLKILSLLLPCQNDIFKAFMRQVKSDKINALERVEKALSPETILGKLFEMQAPGRWKLLQAKQKVSACRQTLLKFRDQLQGGQESKAQLDVSRPAQGHR